VRGIVTRLSAEYVKKGRGLLTAEARVQVPDVRDTAEHEVRADITDGDGALVCRVTATWRLQRQAPR
jgi:acyl-coenzyme A thioesterase PaaI-like protein